MNLNNIEILIDQYIEDELRPIAEKMKADMMAAVQDKRFPLAVKLIVETNACTTGQLQRQLHVGYGKAAIFIDVMEALGMVTKVRVKSDNDPVQQRQVLPPAKDYLEYLAQ